MKQQKKATNTWALGHINWYDPKSGKGSIIGDDGVWYRIHEFSKIEAKLSKSLNQKVRVEFELANDSVHPIIKSIRKSKDQTKKKPELPPAPVQQKARTA
jgi:cold shock CspA family protein